MDGVAQSNFRIIAAGGLSLMLHGSVAWIVVESAARPTSEAADAGALSLVTLPPEIVPPTPPPAPPPAEPKAVESSPPQPDNPPQERPEPREVRPAQPQLPMPPPEPELVRAGIDESNAMVPEWKGFAEATDHQAPNVGVNQSGFTPDPGQPTPKDGADLLPGDTSKASPSQPPQADPAPPEVAPAPPPQQPTPIPQEAPQTLTGPVPEAPADSARATEPAPAPAAEVSPEPSLLPPVPEVSKVITPQSELSTDQLPQPAPDQTPPTEPVQAPTMPPPAPATALPQVAATPGAEQGNGKGTKADDESDAGSDKNPLVVKWGKVLAGRGVAVKTSKPRWSLTTLMTARPRDTMVRITFAPTGKVRKAELLGGGSGYSDVDGPLVDAITHRWTASGARFDEARTAAAEGTVVLYFTVVFGT